MLFRGGRLSVSSKQGVTALDAIGPHPVFEKRHWHYHPAVQSLRGLCRSCGYPVCRGPQRWRCGAQNRLRNPRFSAAAWKERQTRDERVHWIHGSRRAGLLRGNNATSHGPVRDILSQLGAELGSTMWCKTFRSIFICNSTSLYIATCN